MKDYHFTNMSSVLVWFFMHFAWVRQFNQAEWKELKYSKYSSNCRLCNKPYLVGDNIFWKDGVGCIHPECYDQLFELSLFMEEQESFYNEVTHDPYKKTKGDIWFEENKESTNE